MFICIYVFDNKSCFDCGEKGVTYVLPKFGVFLCSRCSGIHREVGNMVKGLGVSNFTDKEISFLQSMGNDKAKDIWLAKFPSRGGVGCDGNILSPWSLTRDFDLSMLRIMIMASMRPGLTLGWELPTSLQDRVFCVCY